MPRTYEEIKESMLTLLYMLAALAVVGVVAALLIFKFGYGLGASVGIGLAVLVLLCVVWVAIHSAKFMAKRMNYSEDASEALQQFAQALGRRLVSEQTGITKVTAMWAYGYPKIALLFSSTAAFEKAKSSDLLSKIATDVSEFVRRDEAFGRNRDSFDVKQALYFTADIQSWNVNVEIFAKAVEAKNVT